MSFFNTKDLSELTTNMMSDCSSMESMLSSTIPPLIANGISVTLTCVLLALFDWRLALCVFITLPIAFLVIWCSRKYQIKLFEKQVETKLNASSQVQEYLEGIKIIKSCNLSGVHFRTLNRALLEMKKIAVKVEMVVGIFMSSASMILQAGIGITIFVGTILLVNGQIELLPLLMFFLIVTKILVIMLQAEKYVALLAKSLSEYESVQLGSTNGISASTPQTSSFAVTPSSADTTTFESNTFGSNLAFVQDRLSAERYFSRGNHYEEYRDYWENGNYTFSRNENPELVYVRARDMLFLMWSMRQNEYLADEFAYKIGFGLELATVLDQHISDVPHDGFLSAIYSTHPCNDDRVAALQNLGVPYSRY